MGRYDSKVPQKGGKWIGLILVLLFTQPLLVIPLAVFGGKTAQQADEIIAVVRDVENSLSKMWALVV